MTEDDLLKALRAAVVKTPGGEGLRVEEIAEASGIGEKRVRVMLRRALEAGTVVRTKRNIPRIDGVVTTVTTYKLAKAVKTK